MTPEADLPVDLDRLAAWMETEGLGRGAITHATAIHGGTQNILLRFTFSGTEYVLRRPPIHKRANSDETMRREARVLAALADSEIPIPRLLATCADADVLGAAFYLMEPVDGFNVRTGIPEAHRSDPAWHHAMGLELAVIAAELGNIDLAELGLEDFGRPDGWIERQVPRWRSQLEEYAATPEYPPGSLPDVDRVGSWLDDTRPSTWRPGLIHGDFHLGNVIFANNAPRVAAVVDWELATIGDPLLDLGHCLATWPPPGAPNFLLPRPIPGLPTTDELVAAYGARSSRPLEDLVWFRVLACYRLGIILEGTYARACAGKAPTEIGDLLHTAARNLVEQALQLIDVEG